MKRQCRDCPPGSKRPAPHPGPRCATHHREAKRARSDSAHKARIFAAYGLEAEGYAALLAHQGGACAICQIAKGVRKRLAVDHDHKLVGRESVRGLLCGTCNNILGRFRDDPERFLRAAEYLRNPPARAVLGVSSDGEEAAAQVH